MTGLELYQKIEYLKTIFTVARLVNVSDALPCRVLPSGEIEEDEGGCFELWGKSRRCDNCISAKAFAAKGQLTKFEFVKNEVYFITSKYVEADGKPYVLQLALKIDDKVLFDAYGKGAFISSLARVNEKLYVDPLTGAYNRRYFDEQLVCLQNITAIAVLDIDGFSQINEKFGSQTGDATLAEFAKAVKSCIRSNDTLIRFSGDQFIIAFHAMKQDFLHEKLEQVRLAVGGMRLEARPELRVTASIGGYFCGEYSPKAISQAQDKLYEAKLDGDCVRL